MSRRTAIFILVIALVAITAVALPGAATLDDTPSVAADSSPGALDSTLAASGHVEACAAEPPDDFSDPDGGTSGTIGWVDGYWYNEPLEVDGELENPLTEEELDELVSRTAARVEALRCLPFDDVPPIKSVTVEERIADAEERMEDVDEEYRDFKNAQMKTKLLIGTDEDAVAVEAEQRGATATAYYNIEEEYMGFVVNEPGEFEINQDTLAHELLHALQDQHFDITVPFERTTNDGYIAALAVVEGDATLVDGMYADNCEQGWEDECLEFQPDLPEPPNWGDWVNTFAAYSTPLVAETYEQEGWDGVNELLEEYPESTVEAIYPEKYGEFETAELTVEDQSSEEWERVTVGNSSYDVVGPQYMLGMFLAPTLETGGMIQVIDVQPFLEEHSGGLYNYDHPAVSGWQGDSFYTYATDEGDRASVWKTAWEDEHEAATFAASYEELIDVRDGTLVDGYENVYTFEDTSKWGLVIAVEQVGDRVWIGTAPTVDDLEAVHDIELVEADDQTPTPTPADDGDDDVNGDDANGVDDSDDADDGEADDAPGVDDTDDTASVDDDGAGFGVAVGVLAILSTALVLRRRHAL